MSDAPGGDHASLVPESIERFVRQLLVTYKATKLYPSASDIPRDSAEDLVTMVQQLLRERSDLRVGVTKTTLLFDGEAILPQQAAFGALATELYEREVAEVCFHDGTTSREVLSFLRAVLDPAEVIERTGGFEQRLWDLQVDSITVRSVETRVIDADELGDGASAWPPPDEDVDAILQDPRMLRPGDRRTLVRFASDGVLLAGYVGRVARREEAEDMPVTRAAELLTLLARFASSSPEGEREVLLESLGEAALGLEPNLRRGVLGSRLLHDARVDDTVRAVLEQLDPERLCDALAEGPGKGDVARDGLARALRNLLALNLAPRESVLAAARTSMRARGVDEAFIASVVNDVLPVQLHPGSTPGESGEDISDTLRLIDLALVPGDTDDRAMDGLRREATVGISDGEVLLSLVTLIALTDDAADFDALMAVAQEGLTLALETGEYAAAADAAEALAALEQDEGRDREQRARARNALVAMADMERMRSIVRGIRLHDRGTLEREACERLLSTLGSRTITPLLELLADEVDMSLRKTLVGLIAVLGGSHLDELGARTDDARWYFVRNVASILGSTHDEGALPYLERTLRHADARVRRESMRAVAEIGGPRAEEPLVGALGDADPRNVTLAARYLGTAAAPAAVDALLAVVRDGSQGAADASARREAVEALGVIGSPEAEEALRAVARRSGLFRRGHPKELRAAAAAALGRIESSKEEASR